MEQHNNDDMKKNSPNIGWKQQKMTYVQQKYY